MVSASNLFSTNVAAAVKVHDILQARRQTSRMGGRQSALFMPARWGLRQVRWLRDRRLQSRLEGAQRLLNADNLVLSIPAFRGSFETEMRNNLTRRILQGFEQSIARLFEVVLQPGQHVVDVGANVGLYTVLAAKLVGPSGRVLAAEPVPSMVQLCRSNIARNHLAQVELFPGAVTSQRCTCSIEYVPGGEEYSSLGSIAHPDAPRHNRKRVEVPGETLDELVERHGLRPALVKVDTEGAEGLVLTGAGRVLQKYRPIVASELDHRLLAPMGFSSAKIIDLFAQHDYRVFDEGTGCELFANQGGAPFVGDIIALPKEACPSANHPSDEYSELVALA